eukprot:tig00000093_g3439.t1
MAGMATAPASSGSFGELEQLECGGYPADLFDPVLDELFEHQPAGLGSMGALSNLAAPPASAAAGGEGAGERRAVIDAELRARLASELRSAPCLRARGDPGRPLPPTPGLGPGLPVASQPATWRSGRESPAAGSPSGAAGGQVPGGDFGSILASAAAAAAAAVIKHLAAEGREPRIPASALPLVTVPETSGSRFVRAESASRSGAREGSPGAPSGPSGSSRAGTPRAASAARSSPVLRSTSGSSLATGASAAAAGAGAGAACCYSLRHKPSSPAGDGAESPSDARSCSPPPRPLASAGRHAGRASVSPPPARPGKRSRGGSGDEDWSEAERRDEDVDPHTLGERKRRGRINDLLAQLKALVPKIANRRTNKAEVLAAAIKHVGELAAENARLKRALAMASPGPARPAASPSSSSAA